MIGGVAFPVAGFQARRTCKGSRNGRGKIHFFISENPAGKTYVLVVYGEESAQTEHPLGLTSSSRTVSQLSFLTAVHTAREIAAHAGISDVFVCTASTPQPQPVSSGMFIYVPAHDELSSNVVGLNVYNKDKQNIGKIKDIALDAFGLNGYIVNMESSLGPATSMLSCAVGNQLQCPGRHMACDDERKR